jgi:YHS domain-containing protein
MFKLPKLLMIALAGAVMVLASLAQAGQINTNSDNLAIDGYDPVAYFTQSRAVEGVPDFQTTWQGATWQFSSAEHKALFEASPEAYAPRYGGYCAGSMSVKGVMAKIDPQYWQIIDGNLFLGGDQRVAPYFKEDTQAKIEQADKNWSALN